MAAYGTGYYGRGVYGIGNVVISGNQATGAVGSVLADRSIQEDVKAVMNIYEDVTGDREDDYGELSEKLYKQSLENEYYQSLEDLLTLPENFERLVTPNTSKDLEDMTDEDLKSMIEDVIADMIKSGELEAGSESEEAEMEMEPEEVEDEEVDLAELLKEIEEMEEDEKMVNELDSELTDADFRKMKAIEDQLNESSNTSLNEEPVSIIAVIAGMVALFSSAFGVTKAQAYAKKRAETDSKWKQWYDAAVKTGKDIGDSGMGGSGDLEEAYSTIETLKSELNEINLLNAKLILCP